MSRRVWLAAVTAAALVCALFASAASARVTVEKYDTFQKPGGYTLADYMQKWSNPYGLGEMDPTAQGDNRNFSGGTFNLDATPFKTGFDFSVYDHLKYIGVSNKAFPVPTLGAVTFSSDIKAATPGAKAAGFTQQGVYGPSGSWTDPDLKPPLPPYSAHVFEGQQAGAVMNMVDFCTGQLFDWFIAGHTAFALIERLPTNVTGNTTNPGCPGATYVGRDKMYTQIIREESVSTGVAHHVSITYGHLGNNGIVYYEIDGRPFAAVQHVGIPLDKQHVPYTGTYPSLGPGENLGDQIKSFQIGHGLFSLIDAFPFQHPEAPELSVSIPVGDGNPADIGKARLFGQGARASFDNFEVTTIDDGH